MPDKIIFLPMLTHMLLVILLYMRLAKLKRFAASKGDVDEIRRALFENAWPDYVIKVNNNIHNQFELPLLFYALTFVFWSLQVTSPLVLILSWFFVVTRVWHSVIHIGVNAVIWRRRIFTWGCYTILVLWLYALYTVLFID